MALSVVVQESVQLAAGFPITLAALRRLGLPTVSVGGSVATGDLAAGAVTPAKFTPGAYSYAIGYKTGSAGSEVYTLTLDPALTGLAAGVWVVFQAELANTGTGVSLNVNATGNVALTGFGGVAIVPGDLRTGGVYAALHNGTAWQLATLPGQPLEYNAGTATGTVDVITLTLTPSTLVLNDLAGRRVRFKASGANTAAVTLQVNALAAIAIKKHGSLNLGPGDLVTGGYYEVIYDGTNYQLVTVQGVLAQYQDSVTDTGVANAYIVNPPIAGTAHSDFTGKRLRWKVVNASTGASTLQIRAIATPPAILRGTVAIGAGDLKAGSYVETVFDGTNHQLVSPGQRLLIEKYAHCGAVVIKTMTNAVPSGTTITVTGHTRVTGDAVSVGTTGTCFNLVAGTLYYVRAVDANTLSFHATAAAAVANTGAIAVVNGTGVNGLYHVPLNASNGVSGVIYHGTGTTADQAEFTVLFEAAFSNAYFMVSAQSRAVVASRYGVVSISQVDGGLATRKRLSTTRLATAPGIQLEDPAELHFRAFEYV